MTLPSYDSARPAVGLALLLGFLAAAGGAASAQSAAAEPDFNGDGFADLAIGAGLDAVGAVAGAGAVNVLYGSGEGLAAAGNQLLSQESTGIDDVAESGDFFGRALGWGDFDGDGFHDLAIGAWGEDFGPPNPTFGAGLVHVLYGTATGLRAAGAQVWSQDSPGVPDDSEPTDSFGFAVEGGDFNGDGFDDLAQSAITEDLLTAGGNVSQAGAVTVLYGSAAGLSATGAQLWSQDSPGVLGDPDAGDTFGRGLAAGDYNGDGLADLAIGAPSGAGEVNVLYGSILGLTSAGNQLWDQDSPGVPESRDGADSFGQELAAGDLNGDGFDDLAIGVPDETLDGPSSGFQGAVNVLYGTPAGLTATGAQLWQQGRDGVVGYPERFDLFGNALAVADLDGDGFEDLAVGTPLDDLALVEGKVRDVGSVNLLYGTPLGLSSTGNRRRQQDTKGVPGRAEEGDRFGRSLFAADFDGDDLADLAVGVLLDDAGNVPDAGAVNVLYGTRSRALASGRNQLWHQDKPGIQGRAASGESFGEALP